MTNAQQAAVLRAKARGCRPGSTLIMEYLQQACELSPGHAYRASQPGWEECSRCTHVRQVRQPVESDPRRLTRPAHTLSASAQQVYSRQQLVGQDRAWHFESRQAVGSAYAEARRGAAQLRKDLASPFEPGRKDSRDNTLGMPWEMALGRPGSGHISPHPVVTAHMYPRVRNGWRPNEQAVARQMAGKLPAWSFEGVVRSRNRE